MSNLDAIKALAAKQAESADDRHPQSRPEPPQGGVSSVKDMLGEFDLLALIRQDTGEQGHASADRVDFERCPICGHDDCFSYYPSTASWHCFGASNSTGYEGGTALEYYKATRADDDTEAVKWLRGETGHPYESSTQAARPDGSESLILPPWTATQAATPPSRNPVLIDGLLRRGHVMLLAAKGKAGKSWLAVQLACAVATGGEWAGRQCAQGGVLYIDPEIDRKSLDNRFASVCAARGIDPRRIDESVSKWPLRGVEGATADSIVHDMGIACGFGRFALVVIDSCSVFVEGDENSSVDVRRFAAKVLRIAAITGASVLLVHHYGKGGAGDRDTADRARGSSVWLDFPDAALYLTEVFPPSGNASDYLPEGARAFVLEAGGMREFAVPEPTRLLFAYPVHRIDADGITDGWKPNSGQRTGADKTNELRKAQAEAKRAATAAALLAYYYAQGIGSDGMLLKDAAEAVGVDSRALVAALDASDYFEIVQVTQRKRYVRPKHAPRGEPPKLPLASD